MRIPKCTLLIALIVMIARNQVCAQTAPSPVSAQQSNAFANVVSASPLPLTALEGTTYFGIGVEYERFIGKAGHFSVNAPLFAGRIGLQPEVGELYTFAPGFRYHPAGNTRKLDFSFGPQLLLGRENYRWSEYVPTRWDGITGLMLQMNLDLHVQKHGLIGLYTAWGLYDDGNYSNVAGVAILLGLKIGTRF